MSYYTDILRLGFHEIMKSKGLREVMAVEALIAASHRPAAPPTLKLVAVAPSK